jgi:hypothetical protein
MARASSAFENACLQGPLGTAGATNIIPYLSVHSADPGTTGASEISGGGYARQSETFGAPSSGSMSNTNSMSVSIGASTTCAYVGHYSASTAGTYEVGAALSSSVTFVTAGTLTFAAGADSISIS